MSAVQLRQQQMAMNETMFKIILRLRWMTLVHQHRQTKVSNGHAKKALPMAWKIIVQTLRILFQHVSRTNYFAVISSSPMCSWFSCDFHWNLLWSNQIWVPGQLGRPNLVGSSRSPLTQRPRTARQKKIGKGHPGDIHIKGLTNLTRRRQTMTDCKSI